MDSGDGGEVASAAAGPPTPLEWKFSQVFGERAAGEEVQEGKKNIILMNTRVIYLLWGRILWLGFWFM